TCIITNKTIGTLYRERLAASLENTDFQTVVIEIEDGEEYKSLETASELYGRMCEAKIERFTPVIGLGGGVVGDLAAYIASTYLRGLPFYNIPTSLIAQVDSSIGGKTGVNLKYGKNLVGTFCQPVYVHTDIELLNTLDKREFKSGMAEVVKHAIIKGEKFLDFLEKNMDSILKLDTDVLEIMISECVKIKGDIVMEDEKETGLRRLLNLGHTLGHGLEAAGGYGKIKHGEAIAIGMIAASEIACRSKKGSRELTDRIRCLLQGCGLPVRIHPDINTEEILNAMHLDKKVRDRKLEFVLPVKPGEVVAGVAVDEQLIREVIEDMYEK
ncbi:3-dehydroquinate synthase, partial [Elusimicrobiota bacterium]